MDDAQMGHHVAGRQCSRQFTRGLSRGRWFAAMAAGTTFFAASVAAGPTLTTDPQTVDFGAVPAVRESDTLKAHFTLKNTGDERLRITRVRSTCGCVGVVVGARDLAPGATTELTVDLDLRDRYGLVRKYVYVESTAQPSPLRILVRATVPDTRTHLLLWPAQRRVTGPGTFIVTLKNYDQSRAYRLERLDLPSGCTADRSMPLALPKGGGKSIRITCSRQFLAHTTPQQLVAHTTHPEFPEMTVLLRPARQVGEDGTEVASPPRGHDSVPASGVSHAGGQASLRTAPKPSPVTAIGAPLLRNLARALGKGSDMGVIDVRPRELYAEGHIPKSVSFPPDMWQQGANEWVAKAVIIVVAEDEDASQAAAKVVSRWGYRGVLRLRGGMQSWVKLYGSASLKIGAAEEKSP